MEKRAVKCPSQTGANKVSVPWEVSVWLGKSTRYSHYLAQVALNAEA